MKIKILKEIIDFSGNKVKPGTIIDLDGMKATEKRFYLNRIEDAKIDKKVMLLQESKAQPKENEVTTKIRKGGSK